MFFFVKLKEKWYVFFFILFFYFIFLFFLLIFYLFLKRNLEEVFGEERKSYFSTPHLRAENVHALKMFDDISKYIKKYKNNKNKIYLMYVMLNEEFLELCKNQESTNLESFKLVISCFFSKRIVLELEDVSGVGLPV